MQSCTMFCNWKKLELEIHMSSYDFSYMISNWVLILSNELYVSPILMSSPAMITHWEMRCFDAHGELLWKLIVRQTPPFFTFKVQMYYYFSWCFSIGVCCVLALWIARSALTMYTEGHRFKPLLRNSVGILHYYRSLSFRRRSRKNCDPLICRDYSRSRTSSQSRYSLKKSSEEEGRKKRWITASKWVYGTFFCSSASFIC